MLGEKAFELIKQLDRNDDSQLPPYNEDIIRQVFEEIRTLFEQNRTEMPLVVEGDSDLLYTVHLRHAAIERNKRCLLSYIYNRMQKIREMRWGFGSILPADIKYNMSEHEVQWFGQYSKMLAGYMRVIGQEGGLDLTQDMAPPKSLYVQVRCLTDHGEFETQDGDIIVLNKNSQHYLLRSECEHLIHQGVLEHIVH